MKNGTKFSIYVCLILVVLFNIVSFFVSPDAVRFTAKFWVAYGFVMVTYIVQLITNVRVAEDSNASFINIPIVLINVVLTILSTIVGILALFLDAFSLAAVVIVCILILAINILVSISLFFSKKSIDKTETNAKLSVMFMKEKAVEIKVLYDSCSDELKNSYKALYDQFLYADNTNNDKLQTVNNKIESKIVELKADSNNSNLINELVSLVKERNEYCKLYK